MPTIARLQFGDNEDRRYDREYLMTDFKCHITRSHNGARPDGPARCERMELTLVAPGRDDLNLVEWYAGGSSLSGRVLVGLSSFDHSNEQWKEVLFEDAVCFSLSEEYHIDKRMRRLLKLDVMAGEIKVDDLAFKSLL